MKYAFLSLLALPLFAQTQPARQLLPQVREYLQLTDAQVSGIALNNDQYNKSIVERLQRVRQVQAELAVETAKDPLDSNDGGVSVSLVGGNAVNGCSGTGILAIR